MASSSQESRQLDKICRVYKNSDCRVIAVDEVSIDITTLRLSECRFHRAVNKINTRRINMHIGHCNRKICKIFIMGSYSSVTYDEGNYLTYQWDKLSPNENDIQVTLTDVPKIGDTI